MASSGRPCQGLGEEVRMVLTVLVVPVLMGAFLLLMERFEAKVLGVAPPWGVDSQLLGPDSNHAAPST
jgi:hypothetical protein